MTDEIWRDVVGFEDYYQISNHGRVKSLARTVPVRGRQRQKRVRERILRPDVRQRNGRRKVTLYNRHGEKLTVTVAQLMRQVGFLLGGPNPSCLQDQSTAAHLADRPLRV